LSKAGRDGARAVVDSLRSSADSTGNSKRGAPSQNNDD
jgi:hypothetical protein